MAYESKVGGAYRQGCRRSLMIVLVGGVLGVLMVATILWLLGGADARPGSWRVLVAPLVPLPFVAGLLLIGLLVVLRRGRRLDRAFEPWGIKGHQVGGVLRGWHGEVGGRSLDAWFSKGPMLEIYLGCATATRGSIRRVGERVQRVTRAVSKREPLTPSPEEARGCQVYADDPHWMREWLAQPDVEEALGRLLTETESVSPILDVAPDALHYRRRFLPIGEIDAPHLQEWVEALSRLARAAAEVGPSGDGAVVSSLEVWSRLRRGRRFLPLLFGCLALALCVVLGALYVFYYVAQPV